jgi:penicillin-binding protein 1A
MPGMGKVRKNKTKRAPAKAGRKPAKKRSGGGPVRALAWALRKTLKWGTVALVWAVIVLGVITAWYATDLPDVDKAFNATRRPAVTVLAADGSILARRGDVYGRLMRLDQLPSSLPAAVLATEDRRFYSHFGLDIIGLGRAMAANIAAGRIVQGGSTITQQAAKNLFLTPARTVKRKVQELLLALWLERKFSKDQILTIYLNRVYLGAGTYGVDAAARKYFNRSASRLTLYQAAMLAGLLKAPSRYNPLAHPARARARTGQVLKNMVAAGVLTATAMRQAKSGQAVVRTASRPRSSRYFIDWVLEQVPDYVNPGDRDLVVRTTLEPALQRFAEAGVEEALAREGARAGIGQAAFVAITPTGAVRAMVGGRSYAESQFNRATQARRQPGSAFKPFVYLAGLEQGLRPSDIVIDEPVTIGGWRPRNFNKKHIGPVTVKDAFARSINTVAVKVAERAGRGKVIEAARRLGLSGDFKSVSNMGPSLALGVGEVGLLELTAAYGPFANGGAGVWAYGIEEISDGQGRLLYRRGGSGPGRVVGAGDVAAMNEMLAAAVAHGTGRKARLDRPVAGKTGTSQNFRDAWFIGFSADLIAGVWMGNDDGTPMREVTGGGAPAKLWRDFMAAAHAGLPPRPLPGLETVAPAGQTPEQTSEKEKPGFWKSLFATIIDGKG